MLPVRAELAIICDELKLKVLCHFIRLRYLIPLDYLASVQCEFGDPIGEGNGPFDSVSGNCQFVRDSQ